MTTFFSRKLFSSRHYADHKGIYSLKSRDIHISRKCCRQTAHAYTVCYLATTILGFELLKNNQSWSPFVVYVTFDWPIMSAGPLQRIQFWVCLLIESWLTLVGSNSLELANLLAAQFFKKELSLTMSVSEKVCIYLYLELKNYSFFCVRFRYLPPK